MCGLVCLLVVLWLFAVVLRLRFVLSRGVICVFVDAFIRYVIDLLVFVCFCGLMLDCFTFSLLLRYFIVRCLFTWLLLWLLLLIAFVGFIICGWVL